MKGEKLHIYYDEVSVHKNLHFPPFFVFRNMRVCDKIKKIFCSSVYFA
jgi:hypothetical protein